ncbi:hypothetical protein [Leucobacter chromiiresistens]|uniref:hypothetical protein n=1 Tax=Leucobacter chromiiresistens TaxID=1079994 RepID=UPI001FD29811|nr:hypothetical protein [Leucobacter chromiiresistens]
MVDDGELAGARYGGEVAGGCERAGCAVSVPVGGELLRGGGVVSSVLEEGVRAELRVRGFGFERGARREHVEAVAVVGAAGARADAVLLAGPAPVAEVAALVDEGPPVGGEDVGPVGLLLEVVAGGDVAVVLLVGGPDRGDGPVGLGGGGVDGFVDGADEGVQLLAFVAGDGGDGGGAAGEPHPGFPGGVRSAAGGCGDDEPAFAAGFGEGDAVGAGGELRVAGHVGVGEAVEPVHAAGG